MDRLQEKKAIDGIVLVNKPQDLTSNFLLQRVKRLFNAKKAGHTGSLDPMATGMLPICFGEATKVSQFLLDADKCYEVEGCLGIKTNTGDAMGEIIAEKDDFLVSENFLKEVVNSFIGEISQIPPMFSALKHQGQPLYKLARKGLEVERKIRNVHIYQIKLNNFDGRLFNLSVLCSKGTYIRTLVEDIGEKLGCLAHVTKLHRTYTAGFANDMMFSLDDLLKKSPGELESCLLSIDRAIQHLPKVYLSAVESVAIFQGKQIQIIDFDKDMLGIVRLYGEHNNFIGLGDVTEGLIKAKRLVNNSLS